MSVFKPVIRPQQIKPVEFYLDEQDTILDNLQTVIQKEFDCLKERNLTGLTEITKSKSDLMLKLQANDQRLKLHPESPKLKEEYADRVKSIKAKLVKCKHNNETNGKFIKLSQRSLHRLSALLMNMRDAYTRNLTYNAHGEATASGPERLSVSA